MTWRTLEQSERGMWCASMACWGIPTQRLEVEGVGSNYCSDCRARIEARDDARMYGRGFILEKPDGSVERVPPERVMILPNGQD